MSTSLPSHTYVASATPPPSDSARRQQPFDSTLQLLALCPLLAVSDTVVKAVGFSMVVLLLLPAATLLFSV